MVWIFFISLYSDETNTNEYRKSNWKFFLIECCMLDCISREVFDHLQPGILVQIIRLQRVGAERQAQAIKAFPVLVDVLIDHTLCTSSHLHIQSRGHLVRPAKENFHHKISNANNLSFFEK